MNMDNRCSVKNLVNRVQDHVKNIYNDQVGFILNNRDGLLYTNQKMLLNE